MTPLRLGKQLVWMVAIWTLSVCSLLLVSLSIRFALR